jgi:putative glycosyltransferase (TIGR04372 family)
MQICTIEGGKVSIKRLGKLRDEICRYEARLISSKKQSFRFYEKLGGLYLELSDLKNAIKCFDKAIEIIPKDKKLLFDLGRCYLDTEQFQKAEETLILASNLDSNQESLTFDIFFLLGLLRIHLKNMKGAEQVLKEIPFRISLANIRAYSGDKNPNFNIENHPDVKRSIELLHRIQAWEELVGIGTQKRDLEWLERKAQGRPIYITHICGNGWLFSHIISQIEMFTRRLALAGVNDPLIIVINPNRFCNDALTEMYQRSVWMIDDRYPKIRKRLTALREFLKTTGSSIAADIDPSNHLIHIRNNYSSFTREFLEGKTVLEFTKKEEAHGQEILENYGLSKDDDFITFGVREPAYYKSAWIRDTGYEEYWEASFSDRRHTVFGTEREVHSRSLIKNTAHVASQIADVLHTPMTNYLPMLELMAKQGLTIFRMGTDVEQKLPINRSPNIVDYANEGRTEFADLYLFAKCKFLVSGGTGNVWINMAFGKPVVSADFYLLNAGSIAFCTVPNVVIPRMYWFKDEKRFLTMSEILECCRFYQWKDNCQRDGVEHVPNSAEDICEAVDELNKRLDGEWEDLPEDIDLRDRFQNLYLPYHEGYGLKTHLSSAFLRQNADLIQ